MPESTRHIRNLYFRDGARLVDYVLVYANKSFGQNGSEDAREDAKRRARDIFEGKLRDEGLQVEQKEEAKTNEGLYLNE